MTVGGPFLVTVDDSPGISVLRLSGDVDRSAEPGLFAAFRKACATGQGRIGLDFDAVSYLNSTGIALIVGVLREARTAGVEVLGWGLSDHFREIFEITRIVDFMAMHEAQSEALATG